MFSRRVEKRCQNLLLLKKDKKSIDLCFFGVRQLRHEESTYIYLRDSSRLDGFE